MKRCSQKLLADSQEEVDCSYVSSSTSASDGPVGLGVALGLSLLAAGERDGEPVKLLLDMNAAVAKLCQVVPEV